MLDFNKELEKFEPMQEVSVNDADAPQAKDVDDITDVLRILANNKMRADK
jgi:hypothetical protein